MSRILVAFGVALLHVCTALVLTPTKAPFPTSRASTCPRVSNAPLARSRLIVLQETEDGGVEAHPTYVPTDKEVSEVMREMPLVWTESIEERRARAVAKVMAKNDPVEMAKAKKAAEERAAAAAAAKAAAAAEAEKKKAAAAEAARIKNEEAAKKKAAAAEVAAAKKAAAAEAKKAKDEAAKAKKAAAAEAKKAKADAAKAKKAAGR